MTRIYNISDRENTPGTPRAILIGGQKIRPGRFIDVDESVLSGKLQELHGTLIWIGNTLPAKFVKKVVAEVLEAGVPPMTIAEARAHLDKQPVEALLAMCEAMVPALLFATTPAKVVLVARLGRALFTAGRVLAPNVFFFLRRWTKKGDTYFEAEAE